MNLDGDDVRAGDQQRRIYWCELPGRPSSSSCRCWSVRRFLHRTRRHLLDTLDHLKADDIRQGATVLAGMLLQAANSDKTLPREPLPTEEKPTNPFKYPDPRER